MIKKCLKFPIENKNKLIYCIIKFFMKYNNSKGVIGIDNMQCVIGVKESSSGYFEVIIAFQGTGGYGTAWGDKERDLASNLTGNTYSKNGMHEGYKLMAEKLEKHEKDVQVSLKSGNYSLADLIDKAGDGKAHITILGHSMGGAIAQCYAIYLNQKRGINKKDIKGRTFNPALAIDYDESDWGDWFNLCVSTDSVTSGLVPGSIIYYGIHRLGDTIWLYDDRPDKDLGLNTLSNIAENKHVMTGPIQKILEKTSKPYEE